jgi:sterol 3beta-glucosyltransferase
MKTILIVTSGSRGDVQPYVALAIELKARGARVVVATEKRMEDFVKSFAGLE